MDKIRVNQERIRAREIIAEVRSNNEKALQLIHAARNLLTVSRLMREEIYWRRRRNLTKH
jgi:hypothetical protein